VSRHTRYTVALSPVCVCLFQYTHVSRHAIYTVTLPHVCVCVFQYTHVSRHTRYTVTLSHVCVCVFQFTHVSRHTRYTVTLSHVCVCVFQFTHLSRHTLSHCHTYVFVCFSIHLRHVTQGTLSHVCVCVFQYTHASRHTRYIVTRFSRRFKRTGSFKTVSVTLWTRTPLSVSPFRDKSFYIPASLMKVSMQDILLPCTILCLCIFYLLAMLCNYYTL